MHTNSSATETEQRSQFVKMRRKRGSLKSNRGSNNHQREVRGQYEDHSKESRITWESMDHTRMKRRSHEDDTKIIQGSCTSGNRLITRITYGSQDDHKKIIFCFRSIIYEDKLQIIRRLNMPFFQLILFSIIKEMLNLIVKTRNWWIW